MTISKALLAALTIAMLFAMRAALPSADAPDYARFADDDAFPMRNVISNAGFVIVGAIGVAWSARHRRELGDDHAAALTFSIAVIATAFGSAYFHANPLDDGQLNRFTLLWDRLPMTVAFAGLLAIVLRDRVFPRLHRVALPLLAAIGIGTVLYWYATNDLYPYAFFQFYTAVGTLLMIAMLRPMYTEAGYVAAAAFLFGTAKVFEDFDDAISVRWGIGGHPLKHVTAALAAMMILLWLMKRVRRDVESH